MIEVTLQNGVETKAFLASVDQAIKDGMPSLFRSLGDIYVADVKHRIISQDDGRWAPASKWLRAKSGQGRVLDGMEKYVKARITANRLAIVGTAPGWTLSQHDEGFTNQLESPGEEHDGSGRVVLKIRDGRPLNLYVEMKRKRDGSAVPQSQTFAFVPKKAGRTPARKIWPTADEAISLGNPTASQWFKKIIEAAGGSLVHG